MKNKTPKIILASGSPRRIGLLKLAGFKFLVKPSKIKEKINPRLSPIENVKMISRQKALDVTSPEAKKGIIIAADTIGELNGEIFGKPKNKIEAQKMLQKLSGKEHKVITCLTIVNAKTKIIKQKIVITKVKFRKLTKNLIKNYAATGEPMGKAAAYAIQGKGAMLIESIKGDFLNIIGLPIDALLKLLKKL